MLAATYLIWWQGDGWYPFFHDVQASTQDRVYESYGALQDDHGGQSCFQGQLDRRFGSPQPPAHQGVGFLYHMIHTLVSILFGNVQK